MNYASPGPSSGPSVRTSQTTAEIRSFQQRVDTSKESPEVHNRVGKFNTLNNSMLPGSRSTILYPRQLSLFFMKKGYSKAIAHGSAKVIKFNKSDAIADWQEYLVSEVLSHPAWKSFPNGQQYEIDPKRGVCVGFWESSGIPNANMMEGSGSIANLLEMCENPRLQEKNLTATSGIGKGGRLSPVLSIRMAYTVHIRIINDSSSEDHVAGEESTEYHELEASTLSEREANRLFQDQYLSEEKETLEVVPNIPTNGKEKQILSTIPPDRPILATTPRPITPLESRSQLTQDSLLPDSQLASTSTNPPLRKRSLTLLSPDKITTLSTRQTKKTRTPTVVHLSSSDGDDESEHFVTVSDN